jgi:hypothetical protein
VFIFRIALPLAPAARVLALGLPLAIALANTPAQAGPTVEVDVMTDHRVRGLSWSDGEAAGQVYASVPLTPTLNASAQVTTLRGSDRHGGANLGLDMAGTYSDGAGLLNWYGSVVGHFFAGAQGNLDYAELQGGIGGTLGPADLTVMASYAPSQDAIGGSNFYRRVEGRMGVWGTPYTLRGHVGRSSGSVDDARRAERLRPGGAYTDWSLGLDYFLAPVTLSLTYSDTDISRSDIRFPEASQHFGSRFVVGAQVGF